MEHAARSTRNEGHRAAILDAWVGNVDRVQTAIVHLSVAAQTTAAQDAAQIVQVCDMVEQNRIRNHCDHPQEYSLPTPPPPSAH